MPDVYNGITDNQPLIGTVIYGPGGGEIVYHGPQLGWIPGRVPLTASLNNDSEFVIRREVINIGGASRRHITHEEILSLFMSYRGK